MLNPKQVKEWLENAGRLALKYFRNVEPSLKDNHTYVTEADLRVQDYLMERIQKAYPNAGVLAEERDLIKPPENGETYFAVDPIDGTASFVAGLPVWGIALGVINARQPVAGYFYMPATGDFFFTGEEGPVYRNDTIALMRPSQEIHRESIFLTVSRAHQKLSIQADYPGKIRCLGSTVAHICFTATGSADACAASSCHIWDLAAGLALLVRNGGRAVYVNGETFSIDDHMLSGKKSPMPILFGSGRRIEYFRQHTALLAT